MKKDWKDILYDKINEDEGFFINNFRKSKRIKDGIKRDKAKNNRSRAQGGGTTD
jgi:hypothetical protein